MERIDTLEKRLDKIEGKLDSYHAEIIKAQLEHAKIVHCPKAGACLILEPKVEKLEIEVGRLHDWMERAKGAGMATSAIWGAIGAFVLLLVKTLFFPI